MGRLDEIVSEQFARWEQRGRGWQVWENPVEPEPPFRPFVGFTLPKSDPDVDDGRKPGFLASFFEGIERYLNPTPPVIPEEPEPEPEPEFLEPCELIELQTSLPADLNISKDAFEQFVFNLSHCQRPIAFEILGLPGRVTAQFASGLEDVAHVQRQLQAHFPDAAFLRRQGTLESAWNSCEGQEVFVVEFGLAQEFMLPLATGKLDPFVGIVGALAELKPGDLGLFQVLFQATSHPWRESIVSSVTHADGKPFFVNWPELVEAAENKVAKQLYAAVVRVATRAKTFDRAVETARDLACSLTVFAKPQGNELIPLSNVDYRFEQHVEDVIARQSRRSGMLLNSDELIGFVHLPSSTVRSPALLRQTGKTKAAPEIARQHDGLLLGNNIHLEEAVLVRLAPEQRVRHTHIIGASGTGKSTLLFNLIRQDIENGEGIAVLDPHGDLIDKILGVIPPERIHDVVLVDPSDEEYAIGFNILLAHSELEKTLLASDLVAVFQRLSASWGDQMQSVLQNAILAFLGSSRGGTLADLRRFLIESSFRSEFLESVPDANVRYYWNKGFKHLSGNKSIGPVLTRLEMFLGRKPILHMVAQPENRLDFAEIMDSGKIFLAKLPEGLLGRENSHLLGTLLISKFQQLAMSRQVKQIEARRDFWIYLDEFHNFITPSMAEILSGARKYRIGLTLAHHQLRQLQRDLEVASAVLSHPCTRICFRVGDEDARKLSEGFSFFEPHDLQNLGTGEAIARIERSDFDFNLAVSLPEAGDKTLAAQRRQEIITASREKYGTPRARIEADLLKVWEDIVDIAPAKSSVPKMESGGDASSPGAPPAKAKKSKAAEIPKPTDSEKESLASTPASAIPAASKTETAPISVEPESEKTRDQGRGGDLHITLQKRLQSEAWKLGFEARIEQQLSKGSTKAADLIVSRDDIAIAVEVPVEGSVSDEFGNIKKCLSAGFPRVAVVSLRPKLLQQLSDAVPAALGPEAAAKVSYYSPEEFLSELRTIAQELASKPKPLPRPNTEKIGNYEVEVELPMLTAEENKQREEARIRQLAEVMRRKAKGPDSHK